MDQVEKIRRIIREGARTVSELEKLAAIPGGWIHQYLSGDQFEDPTLNIEKMSWVLARLAAVPGSRRKGLKNESRSHRVSMKPRTVEPSLS